MNQANQATPAIARNADLARTRFHVMHSGSSFPLCMVNAPFAEGYHKAALRIGGGCGQADQAMMEKQTEYVIEGFQGINCVVASGGTLDLEEGFDAANQRTIFTAKKLMVTMFPAMLAKAYPGKVIAMSTTPRTAQMELGRNFGDVLVDGHYHLDFQQDDALVFQIDACELDPDNIDWVADVPAWIEMQAAWKAKGVHTGWWGIEGGGGTRKEVIWHLERGIPAILTANSGRQSDAMVNEFAQGKLMVRDLRTGDEVPVDPSLVTVVDNLNAAQLNAALRKLNIIATNA